MQASSPTFLQIPSLCPFGQIPVFRSDIRKSKLNGFLMDFGGWVAFLGISILTRLVLYEALSKSESLESDNVWQCLDDNPTSDLEQCQLTPVENAFIGWIFIAMHLLSYPIWCICVQLYFDLVSCAELLWERLMKMKIRKLIWRSWVPSLWNQLYTALSNISYESVVIILVTSRSLKPVFLVSGTCLTCMFVCIYLILSLIHRTICWLEKYTWICLSIHFVIQTL